MVGLGLLVLPLAGWRGRGSLRVCGRKMRFRTPGTSAGLWLVGLVALAGMVGLSGCGGYFGQVQQTYTVNIVATATGAGGASLQHTLPVTLTVQ